MNTSKNNFEIQSEWLPCQTPPEKLISFLLDINHLESILPKDKIKNIQSTQPDSISFEIENIIQLTLHIDTTQPSFNNTYHTVRYTSEPFGNYHLELIAQFDHLYSQIILTGHLNTFVLSIAKNKLKHLVQKINKELSSLSLP